MTAEVITAKEYVGVVEIRDGEGVLLTIVEPAVDSTIIRDDDGAVLTIREPTTDMVEVFSQELVGQQGPPGATGATGPQGPQGDPGPKGDTGPFAPLFEQHFAAPAYRWVIVHNLDTYPVTTTVDLNDEEIVGDVTTPDRNTVVVNFAVPMAGTARLKA